MLHDRVPDGTQILVVVLANVSAAYSPANELFRIR